MIDQVWSQFSDALRRWFGARARGGLDAEELLQETLVRLAGGLSELADADRLGPYVWTTARRVLIDARRAQVMAELEEEPEAGAEVEDVTREVAGWLNGFLSELDEDDRTVLARADLEGRPHAEVAEQLGIGVKAMRSRLHRARHRLRARLLACCEIQLDARGGIAGHRRRGDACDC